MEHPLHDGYSDAIATLSFVRLQHLVDSRRLPSHTLSDALRCRLDKELAAFGLTRSFVKKVNTEKGVLSGGLPLRIMFPGEFIQVPLLVYVNGKHVQKILDTLYNEKFSLIGTLTYRSTDVLPSPRRPSTPTGYCHCLQASPCPCSSPNGNDLPPKLEGPYPSALWSTMDGNSLPDCIDQVYQLQLGDKMPVQVVETNTECTIIPVFRAHCSFGMNYITRMGMVVAYGSMTLKKEALLNIAPDLSPYGTYQPITKYLEEGVTFMQRSHRCGVDQACPKKIRSLYDNDTLYIPMEPITDLGVHRMNRSWNEPKVLVWRLRSGDTCNDRAVDSNGFVAGGKEMEVNNSLFPDLAMKNVTLTQSNQQPNGPARRGRASSNSNTTPEKSGDGADVGTRMNAPVPPSLYHGSKVVVTPGEKKGWHFVARERKEELLNFLPLKELLQLEKEGFVTPDQTSQALENRVDMGLSVFGFDKNTFLPLIGTFGAVVVGSFPLALGHPRSFVPNDLDIACPRGKLNDIVDAFTEFGFTHVPSSADGQTAVKPLVADPRKASASDEDDSRFPSPAQPAARYAEHQPSAYLPVRGFNYARQGMAIKAVLKMQRTLPSGKVSVVNILESSSNSAVTPIFLFHSTLVMSYVAFHGLVIPYPHAYLEGEGYINLPMRPMKEKTYAALQKYRARGFVLVDSIADTPHMCGRNSNCPATLRCLLNGQTAHFLFPSFVDTSPLNMAAVRLGKFLPMIRKDFEGGEVLRWKLAGGGRCSGGTIEDPGYVFDTSGVFFNVNN